MKVLVDSSIWIDYFQSALFSEELEPLIDDNFIVINEIILAELIPFLHQKKQAKLIGLLNEIELTKLQINWSDIILLQKKCLSHGINGIGIPDLIITQNAIQNNLLLMSKDKHFKLMAKLTKLSLHG